MLLKKNIFQVSNGLEKHSVKQGFGWFKVQNKYSSATPNLLSLLLYINFYQFHTQCFY